MNIETPREVRLPEGFNPVPGQEVPDLDETVQLIGADGREYRGCLIDGFGSNEGWYWAEWIGPSGLEERVGKEQPIGWKALPSKKSQS